MPRARAKAAPKASADAVASRVKALREHVRESAENRPGVYRLLADSGEVVYVGKSRRVRTRLLSYFRGDHREDKSARMVREASAIEWSYAPNEFAALLEELRLIKRLRPRFNVALKRDARHFAFIGITRGVAPRLVVLRGTGERGESVVYGPFTGAWRLAEALRELSDLLGLRDCSYDRRMQFADQGEIFPWPERTPGCIRHEIGKCLGPCIAAVASREYADRVMQARAFLDGASDAPLRRLEEVMREASVKMEYERAGAFRDKLRRLSELRERFERLRFAVETLTFPYHVPGVDGDDRVYFIRRGVVRGEVRAPQTPEEELALVELARRKIGAQPPEPSASLPLHEIDELMVIASWFRTHPEELERAVRGTAVLRRPPSSFLLPDS
jgi:excinuclease ABC subunit C